MSIETAQGFAVLQLAYQSFEADVKQVNLEHVTQIAKAQLAYQSFADVKLASIPLTDVEMYAKLTYNVLRFAFLGKAFLFDGEKLVEVGVPEAVIYPVLAVDGDKAYFTCGLKEDGSVVGVLYGYNIDGYDIKADKDYVAFIVSESVVYIVNESNTVVGTTKLFGATPLLKGWKLVSRKPFKAIVMSIKE
jgi:hypothetical protein